MQNVSIQQVVWQRYKSANPCSTEKGFASAKRTKQSKSNKNKANLLGHDVIGKLAGFADNKGPPVGKPADDIRVADHLQHLVKLFGKWLCHSPRFLARVVKVIRNLTKVAVDVGDSCGGDRDSGSGFLSPPTVRTCGWSYHGRRG